MALSGSVREAVRSHPDFVPCDCAELEVWQRLTCICKHNQTNEAIMALLRINYFTPEQMENTYWHTFQSLLSEVTVSVLQYMAEHSKVTQYYPAIQERIANNLEWRDNGSSSAYQRANNEDILLFGERASVVQGIQQLQHRHIVRDLKEAFADAVGKLRC